MRCPKAMPYATLCQKPRIMGCIERGVQLNIFGLFAVPFLGHLKATDLGLTWHFHAPLPSIAILMFISCLVVCILAFTCDHG
jgi:hypothetical protein